MANENEINELRRNFISRYANQNYAKYQAIRERVRNCAAGTATMKGIGANSQNGGGNDFTDVMKYLIPTERQKKYPAEFLRYMQMANFPGYTESTLLVALGLLGTGADTIEGMENIPESLKTFFDPVSLNSLRLNINRLQMLDGGAILMLQPMNEEKLKLGESPFEIMVYSMDKYICSQLDPDKGNIFILMDESEFVSNYRLKIPTYNNKYRLHAVDSKGRYYQAALQIIQGSQVAPLVNLVNTSGESISKMLEFALVWAGKKEIKPNYVPSEVFARLNLSAGDIMALLSMKRENPDKIPIKWAELRRHLVESGIGDEEMLAFDEFMESVKEENRTLEIEEETPVPRFEHDEDL